jgi:hypothetical protein
MFILAMFILAVVYSSGGIFLAMFILNQSTIRFTYTLEYAWQLARLRSFARIRAGARVSFLLEENQKN